MQPLAPGALVIGWLAIASCHHDVPVAEPKPQTQAPAPTQAVQRPPRLDRTQEHCIDRGVVERRLGLLTGPLEGDSLALREQALLAGVRSTGALVAYDRGLVLGGFGELITIADGGAWRRVPLGPEDHVATVRVADLDGDADDDLLVLVERSVVSNDNGVTSMPFAHFLAQQPAGLELRSTLALQIDDVYSALRIADVTGDGKPDVITIEVSQPVVYRGTGALRFEREVAGPCFPDAYLNARCSALLDYDRDGDADTDLLAVCADGDLMHPFLFAFDNAGDGRFVLGPSARLDLPDGARSLTELRDLTGDARPDLLLSHLDSDAEPRLALLRGDTGPLRLDAPEAVPLARGALGSTGSSPQLLTATAYGQGGVTYAVAWPTNASNLTVLALGKKRGDAPTQATHRIPADLPAALAIRDGDADSRPNLHVLLDVGCSPTCTPDCSRCYFGRCVSQAGAQLR